MGGLTKSAIFTFGLLMISKVLGFAREMLLAYKYGTSYINDSYAIAVSLPAILFSLFASGFAQSYIPVVTRIKNFKEKRLFFSNVVTILFFGGIIVSVLCIVLDNNIVGILAPGFECESRKLTEHFIDIVAWYLPTYVIFNILSANAQSCENFIIPSICDYIVVNVVVIIFILLSSENNLDYLAYGHVVAMCLATLLLLSYSVYKFKLKYSFVFKPKDRLFKQLVSIAIPVGISVMVNQLNTITDRLFSTLIGVGVTSALEFANRIQSLFLTLTTSMFISLCFPRINRAFANREFKDAEYYIQRAIQISCFIAIPFTLVVLGYSNNIVSLLFERGAFGKESADITSLCLLYYSIGIPFYAFREVCSKALVAELRQKTVLKNTIITVGLNILLDLLLYKPLGAIGLAIATSLSGFVSSILICFEIKSINLFSKNIGKDVLKILLSSGFCCGLSKITFAFFDSDSKLVFIGVVLLFGALYLFICKMLKLDILNWLIGKVHKKKIGE